MEKQERLFVTVRYQTPLGDVDFDVYSFARNEFEKLGRKHRKPVVDKSNRSRTDFEIDNETYFPALCRNIVKEYRGLTEEIKALILRQPSPTNGTDPSDIVPFNWEDMIKMYRTSTTLAEMIENTAMNFEQILGEQRLAEREARNQSKNLKVEIPN